MKSRYTELGEELNEVLEKRRKLCGGCDMIPAKGNEAEHERLTKIAENLRREMRIVRYGKDQG